MPPDYRAFLQQGNDAFLVPLAGYIHWKIGMPDVSVVASILRAGIGESVANPSDGSLPIWLVFFDILRVFSGSFPDGSPSVHWDWIGLVVSPFSAYLSKASGGRPRLVGVLEDCAIGIDDPSLLWRDLHSRIRDLLRLFIRSPAGVSRTTR